MPRVILSLCVLTAFVAGGFLGVLYSRASADKPQREDWLAPLNLSPEQREKIKAIWSESMKASNWQAQHERREAALKERDEAIRALLTDEQKAKHEEVLANFQKKMDQMQQEQRKMREDAVEKTKAELNETQRAAYDELRKKRMEGRGRRGDGSKDATKDKPADQTNPPGGKETF